MQRFRVVVAAVSLAAVFSISPLAGAKPGDATPTDSVAPAELLAVIAFGPPGSLQGLKGFIDAVQPGASAPLTDAELAQGIAGAAGMTSLDGFDPKSGTYLLFASDAKRTAVVGKVTDAAKLTTSAGKAHVMVKGGWAAVGPKALLERIGPYVLAQIAGQPAPTALTATVYLPPLLARSQPQIQAFRRQMTSGIPNGGPAMAQMMTAYVDGLMSLATDADTLVARLETTPSDAWLDLALTPRAGSRLAAFIALQHATDYALLERMPATAQPTLMLGGRMELGPYREGTLSMMAAMYGPEVSRDLIAAMDGIRKAMTGEFAMTGQFTPGAGLSFTQLYGTASSAAADKALVGLLALFKAGRTLEAAGAATTIKARPDTTSYAGATLHGYDATSDYTKVPEAQRKMMEAMVPPGVRRAQLAAFDALTMIVVTPDSLADAKRMIDASRGKAAHYTAGGEIGGLLAGSRARKDSVAMVVDLGTILGMVTGAKLGDVPLLVSLGFADHNAHIRIAVPVTTAQMLMKIAKP
jgi:hypothetical protein